jgi:hypothetical protein
MSDGTQGQLRFLFLDLMQEIEALQEMAAPFIDARSALVLEQLKQDLEGLGLRARTASDAGPWETCGR